MKQQIDFSISSVTERDIDLLLLEEFVATPAFSKWFNRQTADQDLSEEPVISAHRSVTTSSGESDLEIVMLSSDGRVHYLMIENKISAGFQPRQADRYRQRGEGYLRQGDCDGFFSILVAPETYLGQDHDRKGFDHVLSYEAIMDWFSYAEGPLERNAVKQKLLSAAIEKATLGYQPEEDLSVSKFWNSYWKLATELAAELGMAEPSAKPASAGFVLFTPEKLSKEVKLVHKLSHGNMDLQFLDMEAKLPELRAKIMSKLDPDMLIARAGKSGVVRIKVPVLDTTMDFQVQEVNARKGIVCAQRLLKWYLVACPFSDPIHPTNPKAQ